MRSLSTATARLAIATVLAAAVIAPNAAPAAAGPTTFVSDDFNASVLDARWSVVDPKGDGSVSLEGAGSGDAHLVLGVPGGSNHDAGSPNQALRVVQPSADEDFGAEVKFDSVPTVKYQSQGLLAEQDSANWVRFDVHFNGSQLKAYSSSTVGGVTVQRANVTAPSASSQYVRVTRVGDQWTFQTSTSGTSWVTRASFSAAIDVARVGPFAGNYLASGNAPAFQARVDYFFNTASPVVPEDGAAVQQYSLSTATVGSGSVTRSPDLASYGAGTVVTVTAVPAPGWSFAGWSGALSGSTNPAAVTMDANKSVTATFVADTTPPVISNVSVTPASTSAVVTWTTNEPATSSVAYGPTSAYENGSAGNGALTTSHSVTLAPLAASSTYHYRVSSTDGAGNPSDDVDRTFTTEAAAPTSSFVSDDFNASVLDARWSVVDPKGDGSVSLEGAGSGDAHLVLGVPGGSNHDAGSPNQALRVVQPSADEDFGAEVKFDSVPTVKYQSQGLLAEQDSANWVRFDVHFNGSQLKAYSSSTVGGVTVQRANVTAPSASSQYVRVTRVGDQWTFQTSTSGTSWVTRASFSAAIDVARVGPFAGNYLASGNAPAFQARVDYFFNTASPVVPEDGAAVQQYSLSTATVGSGSVTRSPDLASYGAGTVVTVTAVPAPGWSFAGWSGALSGSTNPAAVTMDANKSVTATFVADTTPPVISNVSVTPASTSAVVTWTTNEPATSSVAYGPTSAYENGSAGNGALTTSHSVTLAPLAASSTYHYRVSSTDGAGNITTRPDATFTTQATPPVGGPVIEVWYGDVQGFGQAGRSQVWVNVLGRVSDPQGVASLVYRLNGGAPRALSLGPNNRRLALPGDFNADILYSELVAGANSVVLTATDGVGQVSVRSVTVQYTPGVSLPGPLTVDWSQAGSIGDVAQVVDGEWVLSGGGVRPTVLDYDRTISVGDVGWTDYEVSFPVTVHALDPGGYASPSNGPAVGMMLRWSGHSASGAQPAQGYWPAGALAYYRWHPDGRERYYLIGNQNSPSDLDLSTGLVLGTPYVFKAQVTSEGDGYHYRYKAWPQGQAEPVGWSMEIVETSPGADAGALLLIAHHVDATFGTVTVTPL